MDHSSFICDTGAKMPTNRKTMITISMHTRCVLTAAVISSGDFVSKYLVILKLYSLEIEDQLMKTKKHSSFITWMSRIFLREFSIYFFTLYFLHNIVIHNGNKQSFQRITGYLLGSHLLHETEGIQGGLFVYGMFIKSLLLLS